MKSGCVYCVKISAQSVKNFLRFDANANEPNRFIYTYNNPF